MNQWQEEQLDSLLNIQGEHELFATVTSLAHNIGFDYCAYGMRTPVPFSQSQPSTIMLSNYSPDWQNSYLENNYLTIDPTVQHGLRSSTPIIWSDELFSTTRNLWEEARSYGLNVGWAQSVHETNGGVGMLSLSRSHDELSERELADLKIKMSWLAQTTHLGISQNLLKNLLPDPRMQLTKREVEILRWTAVGRTACDISEILNISERTVNFHISNAITKLDASNKLAATVKAVTLGLLF